MDTIELDNGMSIKCKALTREEYKSLLKDTVGNVLEDFKQQYNIDIHKLKNGHVIVNENDYYTLYFSLDDLTKVLKSSFGSGSTSNEMLLNKNLHGKDFPAQTQLLINELTESLKIDYSRTDQFLLKQIDNKLYQLKYSEEFKKEHLIHFIAVVGEALISKYNAEWDMQLSTDGKTWNPYLIIKGQRIEFFTYLYEDIFIINKKNALMLTEIYKTVEEIVQHNVR